MSEENSLEEIKEDYEKIKSYGGDARGITPMYIEALEARNREKDERIKSLENDGVVLDKLCGERFQKIKRLESSLKILREGLELPDLDCGDNSCHFAKDKRGMRTNGGCRCFRGNPNLLKHLLVTQREALAQSEDGGDDE